SNQSESRTPYIRARLYARAVMVGSSTAGARYPIVLQAIHWLLTLLVAGQITFIFFVHRLQSVEFANLVLGWHRLCGLSIVLLVLLRACVAFRVRAPALPKPMSAGQAWLARIVHGALYLTLIAQPVIGFAMSGARGDSVSVIGLFELPALV